MTRLAGRRIWVAGHRGMVGSALVRRLARLGGVQLLTATRDELDLRDSAAVISWVRAHKPEVVFLAAARVGGLGANLEDPAGFLSDNVRIATSVIDAAHATGVSKLIYVASSAMYPVEASQPLREESLFSGSIDPGHAGYALAKIVGSRLCAFHRQQHGDDFIVAMPCNLYGPGASFDPARSHVAAALLRSAHEARRSGGPMTVWGTGRPTREMLYVDDCAEALIFLAEHYSEDRPVNVGSGQEYSIAEIAAAAAHTVGFSGALSFDTSKPDGSPRRVMDVSTLGALGWTASTPLDAGLKRTYEDFLSAGYR